MANNSNPVYSYTLEEFIDLSGLDPMTYYNLSLLQRSIINKDIIYSQDNVIYTYLPELKKMCKNVSLTDKEYEKYKYKPKLLSYDLYGSTELYFVLLAVNDMCSIKDFNIKAFKALTPGDLNILINAIYVAEENYINNNRKEMDVDISPI